MKNPVLLALKLALESKKSVDERIKGLADVALTINLSLATTHLERDEEVGVSDSNVSIFFNNLRSYVCIAFR